MRRKHRSETDILSDQLLRCLIESPISNQEPRKGKPQALFTVLYTAARDKAAVRYQQNYLSITPIPFTDPLTIVFPLVSLPKSFSINDEESIETLNCFLAERIADALTPIQEAHTLLPKIIEVSKIQVARHVGQLYFTLSIHFLTCIDKCGIMSA